uniref:Uncharacterized protein n=1 Tax=Panagrolaimus sp. PS1159 TaxID=55785 RepID=A0AC35GCE0_9BILA
MVFGHLFCVVVAEQNPDDFQFSLSYDCPEPDCVVLLNFGKKMVFIFNNNPSPLYKNCAVNNDLENEAKANEWCTKHELATASTFKDEFKSCDFAATVVIREALHPFFSMSDKTAFRTTLYNLFGRFGSKVYLIASWKPCPSPCLDGL